MGDRPAVFLTGATGFLGMEILARLLERGDHVFALVRAANQTEADKRIHGVLATLYDEPDEYVSQVTALPGDVTQPLLGLGDNYTPTTKQVGYVIHCAASISFTLPLDEARTINVDGTRAVIDFARVAELQGALRQFIHVSTAFVGGRHRGVFHEDQLDVGQEFRNTYEQTKWEGERLLHKAAADLPTTLVRPSIVMGDSNTGWTPTFNVLYGPLRAFSRGLFATVPARPDGYVDIVPINYVADGIVSLRDRCELGSFHLVSGSNAFTVKQLVDLAADSLGLPVPEIVEAEHDPSTTEQDVYLPYFDMQLLFDDKNARGSLEPSGIVAPSLADYFPTLVEFAQRAEWGKHAITKEQARVGTTVSGIT